MEKQTKSTKLKFLRFLPKTTAMAFQNLPFSLTKPNSSKLMLPGPIIPTEARLRQKKSLAQESTSPNISCMGKIKHKKNVAKQEKVNKREEKTNSSMPKVSKNLETALPNDEPTKGRHMFSGGEKPAGRKSDAGLSERAPSLSQMRHFVSGRDSIANFDWTAQISSLDGDEKETIAPFSGQVVVNGVVLEPNKEINLWKRRTMARPKPLKI